MMTEDKFLKKLLSEPNVAIHIWYIKENDF